MTVGPGSYHLEAKSPSEHRHPAFNSSSSRQPHLRSQTLVDSVHKPIYELQLLEGPQSKAHRLLEINQVASPSQHKFTGSVHRSGHIQRIIDPDYPQTTRAKPRWSNEEASALLDESIFKN